MRQQRKEPDMRHTTAVLVMAVAVLAAACSGGSSTPKLSEAYCSDLQNGANPVFLLARQYDKPAKAADMSYGFAKSSCPDQLKSNAVLRDYLQGWGINPDA